MKNQLYLLIVCCFFISSCNKKCLEHHQITTKITLFSNGENVSAQYANKQIWIRQLSTPGRIGQGFTFDYDEANDHFIGSLYELCPNDRSLTYSVAFSDSLFISALDTLFFEASANRKREKCNDCNIENIRSSSENAIELGSEEITISVEI